VVVKPGHRLRTVDLGVYNILVLHGRGRVDGLDIEGGNFKIDELLVSHDRATAGVTFENTGSKDLEVIKFFGPDINSEVVPYLTKYTGRR
jgi:hypothetical protein